MNITSLKLQTWILSSLLTGVLCLVSPSVFAEDYSAKENKLENVKSAFTLSGYEAENSVNETRWNSEITQGEDGEASSTFPRGPDLWARSRERRDEPNAVPGHLHLLPRTHCNRDQAPR
jgi:hypothetical protein